MLNEILTFAQTNIVHIGYWIAIITLGIVIRSIVKIMSIPQKKKFKLPFFKKEELPKEMTPEDINKVFEENTPITLPWRMRKHVTTKAFIYYNTIIFIYKLY